MKSSQSFFNEYQYFITPSDIIEYSYCPRFIYFMKCLGISQHEENRFKVQVGREIHDRKAAQNKEYLREKIAAAGKELNVSLVSQNLGIRGIVDEVLYLEDGTMSPLDYKYASYQDKLYSTYKNQLIMYALMIEEVYRKSVKRGYLVYCRDGSRLVEVEVTDDDKKSVIESINMYKKVLKGYFPKATRYKRRCDDCCYRNLCVR